MTDVTSEDARPTEHRTSTVRWSRLPEGFGASMARHGRSVMLAVVALVVMNGCFLALRLADGYLPKAPIAVALHAGFARGSMSVEPLSRNALQGRDPYSDCITAEIAVLGGDGVLRNALAPRLMSREQIGHEALQHNACAELAGYLDGRAQPDPGVTYTRFWHGAASALDLALLIMPLDGYRAILLDLTLGLIAATAVAAALAGPCLLIALAPLLVASFVFGGQIGYAQLISYGPGTIAAWTIALALVLGRAHLTRECVIVVAVVAGALEAFFDQMIGVPLAVAIFVVMAGTPGLAGSDTARRPWTRLAAIVVAWGFGLVGSYAIKIGLSTLVLGHAALDEFGEQLAYRAGTIDPDMGLHASRLGAAWLAVLRNITNTWRLGYSDEPGPFCSVVACVALVGWTLALLSWIRALRDKRGQTVLDRGAGYIAGALVVAGWFVVFPEHALRHTFTVRATLIWIIGGWGWLCAAKTGEPGRSCERSPAS